MRMRVLEHSLSHLCLYQWFPPKLFIMVTHKSLELQKPGTHFYRYHSLLMVGTDRLDEYSFKVENVHS